MISVGSRRCEKPRKIWGVKLNAAKVVGLEINREITGLRANDVPRINSDDVPRSKYLHLHGSRLHGVGGCSLLHAQGELHTQRSTAGERAIVLIADGGANAAAVP